MPSFNPVRPLGYVKLTCSKRMPPLSPPNVSGPNGWFGCTGAPSHFKTSDTPRARKMRCPCNP